MHQIWDIPELLNLIFGFLSVGNVAVMASVCRRFWWTAMPYVWREIRTFYMPLQLLPEDALPTNYPDVGLGEFMLTRPLNDSDWARFLTYSNYTKKLHVNLANINLKDYLQLLPHFPSTPLFPNLESTTLGIARIPEPPNPELMAIFLPRTLSEVHIRLWGTGAESFTAGVLQTLTEELKPLHLKSFSIVGLTQSGFHLKKHISHLFRTHRGLQTVDIRVGSGPEILEILHSAGQLLNLRYLCLHTNIRINTHFEQAPRLLFPELETLAIHGPGPFVHGLLDCVGTGNVRSVMLFVIGPEKDTDAEYAILLTNCLVSVGRFIHLKELGLESYPPVSSKLLDHVLTCKELESLQWFGADLDPLETEESRRKRMTVAWPRLTTLELH